MVTALTLGYYPLVSTGGCFGFMDWAEHDGEEKLICQVSNLSHLLHRLEN
jgi:hypothetical protein